MYKHETPLFHRRSKRSNVHRDISAKRNQVKTHLCDSKMPRITYQTHTTILKMELQAAVYGVCLRKEILRKINVKTDKKIISLVRFSYGIREATMRAQETANVGCHQRTRTSGELFYGSMETCQRHWKPCRFWHKKKFHLMSQKSRLVKWAWLQPDEDRLPKRWCQVIEVETSYQYCSLRN